QHKLSNKIVNNTKANTIIVGDLDVKKMAQSKKNGNRKAQKSLNRATQNTGTLSRFVRFLAYKAERIGKTIIEISEKNTTKTCCACGKKHNMTLYDRVMQCDCGNVIDRDRNSAINIMIRYLSQNALVDGLDTFVSNLRKTGISVIG
ncbi:MAG: RNA-guided endonuclease InsQ/TnpB family protein, partial [Methanosarcinales archaeon]